MEWIKSKKDQLELRRTSGDSVRLSHKLTHFQLGDLSAEQQAEYCSATQCSKLLDIRNIKQRTPSE